MNHNQFTGSDKVRSIPEAMSIYINQLVYSEKRKGKRILTLSLGEAYFDIPLYPFEQIDFVKGHHYSDSMGLPELREKILGYYNSRYGSDIQGIKNILISSGSKIILYMVMESILNRGDEVLVYEPAWLSYQEQIRLADAVPKFIPYYCTTDKIPEFFTEKTKLLVLNNPNNPGGMAFTREQLENLYQACHERGIYILMDEAYSDFVVNRSDFVSLASIAKDLDGVFVVNSLSKNMGLSGWRVGYVIAKEDRIADLLKLNQHLITCAPTVLQLYLTQFFDDIIQITEPQIRDVVMKRKVITDYMDKIGLEYLPGSSTFYTFVHVDGLQCDTLDFCLYLLFKYGIATVPGGAYGDSTRDFIRAGIGVESIEDLCYALDTIKKVKDENLTDVEFVNQKLKENGFHRFVEAER